MLKRELVSNLSLLYTWTGSDPLLDPMVLLAHQDMVPIEPGTETAWEHLPFSGAIADGYVVGARCTHGSRRIDVMRLNCPGNRPIRLRPMRNSVPQGLSDSGKIR